MSNPSTAVERLYAGLAKLTPLQWLSTILDHDILEYENASDPGREIIAEFVRSPTESYAALALVLLKETADEVVTNLWPDLATLRADMRRYKAPGATDLSEEAYDSFLELVEQSRRNPHAPHQSPRTAGGLERLRRGSVSKAVGGLLASRGGPEQRSHFDAQGRDITA